LEDPMQSKIANPPFATQIMAIAAHPDDIESWCAGTLVAAIDNGASVRLLLVTSGEHGSSNRQDEPQQVALRREQEARTAAKVLGIEEVQFLNCTDGEVENTRTLRGDLVRWIRRWRPNVLFTHDPEHPIPPYLCHPDHRVVGRAALDATYPLARDHLAFAEQVRDEGLEPHSVEQVWLFASSNTDVSYVDITTSFERKLQARLAHASQTNDPQALREGWRTRAAAIGKPAGLPLAEAFTILRLD